jgi:galactose mutarotase-like enzyme
VTEVIGEDEQGFSIIGLQNRMLAIRVIPALGAKISSLVHLKTGREWMWRPPRARLFTNQLADEFGTSTCVGADECIPTISPCRWAGRDLPDHGEAWSQSWHAEILEQTIHATLRLPISPLLLQRAIRLDGNTVFFSYTATNTSSSPVEFIWAFHPLLTLHEGDEIQLPQDCQTVLVDTAIGCPLGKRGDRISWPYPRPGTDLRRADLGTTAAGLKVYTSRLREGWAQIHNHLTQDRLQLEFDIRQIDTLGVWINRGGWADAHHVAIEPALGAPDPLDVAVRDWTRFAQVEAGGSLYWDFRIDIN